MTTGFTSEQLAFQDVQKRATRAVRRQHPDAMEFRLVRRRGVPMGWTFCTEQYPAGTFGWVTVNARVGAANHALRLAARNDLKNQN